LKDELKEIGRRIVEKCKELSLAFKTIGFMLRTVIRSRLAEHIRKQHVGLIKRRQWHYPALFLSYHYFHFHLERCFAYCSLFPKDYEFVKE